MPKVTRQMIVIDEDLCNGCGLCIPACPEGALEIINGKAVLVRESYCDGLGACLGDCPEGALSVEEKLVDDYDEQAVIETLKEKSPELVIKHHEHMKKHKAESAPPVARACPSAKMMNWGETEPIQQPEIKQQSRLRQWPIQLHLVPPSAPYFKNADISILATCSAFSYGNFHNDYIKDKSIVIACPKLDRTEPYLDKLTHIFKNGRPRSIEVVVMEVPCCTGLVYMVIQAIKNSGLDIPLTAIRLGIKGDFLDSEKIDVSAIQ
jgi:NAD-dependent dihydropyrimidine dehydrogenase PreA subunit